jgi:hypothetical protein
VNGVLSVHYTYFVTSGGTEVDFWTDLNGDGIVQNGERHVGPINSSPAPFEKLQLFNGHRASVHDLNGILKVWIDDGFGGGTSNNGVVDGGEDRNVVTITPTPGLLSEGFAGKSLGTVGGHMAVSYTYFKRSNTPSANTDYRLFLWVDDGAGGGTPDNQIADGSEIRTLESMSRSETATIGTSGSTGLYEVNGHAAVAYARVNDPTGASNAFTAAVWIDDGRGGGTAGDLQLTGGEVRTLDIVPSQQTIQSAFVYNGKSAVSYVADAGSGGVLKFWIDDGQGGGTSSDRVPNGTEVRTLDGPTIKYGGMAIPVSPKLYSLYYDLTNSALKLFTVSVPPTVTSVNPAVGPALGDTLVTVTGINFFPNSVVNFGGVAGTELTYVSDTTLQVRTPPGALGAVDVQVVNPDNLTATLSSAFTYQPNPPPQLTSITPNTGAAFGGTLVSVSGQYFQTGAVVSIGGKPLLNQTRQNSRSIRGTVPTGSEGVFDVTLVNPDSTSATIASGYTYTLGTGVTDVNQSKAYPSPFRPRDGHNAMIFNAPDGSTIRIFDLNGNRVAELRTAGAGVLWDVRNESGEDLASGVYLYLVTDPAGNKFKNRFMVIR